MAKKALPQIWQNRITRTGTRPAREFVFHPDNWRTHPDAQRAALNSILSQIGWLQGVIVNVRSGNLLDGHARVEEALAKAPDTLVPFVEVDLSIEEERIVLALFDPLCGMAETNAEKFLELSASLELDSGPLLEAIAALNIQIEPFEMSELVDNGGGGISVKSSSLEDAVLINKKWQVKYGDLWQVGNHRILCGDSTSPDDVERLMNGERSELLFTSPPYSDQRTYAGNDLSPAHLAKFINAFADFCKYQIVNLGIVRKDSEIFEYWNDYIAAGRAAGYKLLSWNVWDRGQANSIGQQTAMFAIDHEFIFVFGERTKKLNRTVPTKDASRQRQKYKHRRSRRNEKGDLEFTERWEMTRDFKQLGTVTRINCANTIGDSVHPAMFPIALPATYIEAMTLPNQIVCEPFLGSGTTVIACEKLKRRCYGIEISPDYTAVALERLHKTFGKNPTKIN